MTDLRQFFSMNFIWVGNNAGYSVFTLITGWIAPEWVAGILRNRWLACNGITGWIKADFTLR